MNDPQENDLPALISGALSGVPPVLQTGTLKALNRLIGEAIEIPAALLAQKRAKIEAQTETFMAVEAAIAKAAAAEAGADPALISRALGVLVRKSYREQENREKVASALLEELSATPSLTAEGPKDEPSPEPEEEWLNVFEQHAERASTERMQKLWGRVLAGEIRQPGKFSMRTLRFLSEFSQQDALQFAEFADSVFGACAPKGLVQSETDIRPMLVLESAGLITGATGLGLEQGLTYNADGITSIREGNLYLLFRGQPDTQFESQVVALTTLGSELLSLLPNRDPLACARRVANEMRNPDVKWAAIAVPTKLGGAQPIEVLWDDDIQAQQPLTPE